MNLRLIVCLTAMACVAPSARAAVIFYDSAAAWNAATTAQTTRVTFEESSWPINQILFGAWTVDGVSFEGFAGTPGPNIYIANFGSPFKTGNWCVANGDENIDITFAAPPRALAFDASSNQFGEAFLVFYDQGGNSIATLTIPTNSAQFVGVVSDLNIARVNFSSVLGAQQNTGFDTIRTAAPASPCIGDADGDGDIDFADITAVLTSFGAVYAPSSGPGDADKDGDVDFADITSVLTNFNTACP